MRLLENWTKPRDGELVSGFVVAQEGDHLLCVGEDGMAVRLEPPALRRFNPARSARTRHLLIVAGLGWQLAGCAKPAPPLSPVQVSALAAGVACRDFALKAVARHDTCPPAQLDVDANPDCTRAYPDGYDLDCPEFRSRVKK